MCRHQPERFKVRNALMSHLDSLVMALGGSPPWLRLRAAIGFGNRDLDLLLSTIWWTRCSRPPSNVSHGNAIERTSKSNTRRPNALKQFKADKEQKTK
jgi:hypothetical protein